MAARLGELSVVIYFLVKTGTAGGPVLVPIFLLWVGVSALPAASGAGGRVMSTLGTKFTSMTNTRGFAVTLATAMPVPIASKLGLPVSTTHAAGGGVINVGLARGLEAVN